MIEGKNSKYFNLQPLIPCQISLRLFWFSVSSRVIWWAFETFYSLFSIITRLLLLQIQKNHYLSTHQSAYYYRSIDMLLIPVYVSIFFSLRRFSCSRTILAFINCNSANIVNTLRNSVNIVISNYCVVLKMFWNDELQSVL